MNQSHVGTAYNVNSIISFIRTSCEGTSRRFYGDAGPGYDHSGHGVERKLLFAMKAYLEEAGAIHGRLNQEILQMFWDTSQAIVGAAPEREPRARYLPRQLSDFDACFERCLGADYRGASTEQSIQKVNKFLAFFGFCVMLSVAFKPSTTFYVGLGIMLAGIVAAIACELYYGRGSDLISGNKLRIAAARFADTFEIGVENTDDYQTVPGNNPGDP